MKKTLLIILASIVGLLSCENKRIIKVSGKLIDGIQDTLVIKNKLTDDEYRIPVNEDGTFMHEFQGKRGYYYLHSSQVFPGIDLYLQNNQEIEINFETENWEKQRQYQVLNSPENEYLIEFRDINQDFRSQYFGEFGRRLGSFFRGHFTPELVAHSIDSLYSAQKNNLEELTKSNRKLDKKFIYFEQNRILYNSAYFKEEYARTCNRLRTCTLHKDYYDYRSGLNFNDEELLMVIPLYGQFTRKFILNKTRETLPKDEDYILHEITTCLKYISNQKILDFYLINEIELKLEYSRQIEKVYELFMANCTDERYRESATKKLEPYYNTRPGKPSPKFYDYIVYGGGTLSLDDFKGKYVYLDIWATWCGPCIKEFPALKQLKKKYREKNIEFVGISVDEEIYQDNWRKVVKEHELKGIQLFAGKGIRSQFIQDYGITGIPRFILIDPEGIIVNPNAPRPSDSRLEAIFSSLDLFDI